jgi:UDP-N-acetylmuramoyl-tripeptide--D-alanyl-D-alanine ligase
MERIRLADVSRALGLPPPGDGDVAVTGVSTDTRTLSPGDLFVAIRGERFDGHAFVGEAFELGAAAALVARGAGPPPAGRPALLVEDTVTALQDLSAWYRRGFEARLVAVTGTNGKTTTKDMIAGALSTRMNTLKTEGNLNNHIGVPLTLFGLTRKHEAAVVEMGMNHPGEIARLAELAAPEVGVITNVSRAHLETMGDLDSIARAKGELLEALPEDGVAVLNADDPRVMAQARRTSARVETFGLSEGAGTRAVDIEETEHGVRFRLPDGATVDLPVPGRHNVMNALAALTASRALGVDDGQAAGGVAAFAPSAMRMAIVRIGGRTILNDAYNANPGSLAAALETLIAVAAGRPTAAVLGDMLELGGESRAAHREAGARAAEIGVGRLFLLGREVAALAEGAVRAGMSRQRVNTYETKAALAEDLEALLPTHAVVLVKGSRGMRMEEVVELLGREAPAS